MFYFLYYQGLSQFRAKMKAKKAESEATLREQDKEFENLCVSPLAAQFPAADARHTFKRVLFFS